MSTIPPPDAIVLRISGLRDTRDQATVQDAIRRCDPAARTWTDWPRGLLAVQSALPATSLQAAVQSAGFITAIERLPPSRPRGTVAGIFGRILLYAVIGGMLGVAAGVVLGLGNSMLNPDCTRPGSSGGCAIGVGIFGVLLGALGVPVGAVAGLAHGLARRRG